MALIESGGRDAVREAVMAETRAEIRRRQMQGDSTNDIIWWLDARKDAGELTAEEAAIAWLIARHYARASLS